MSLISTYLQKKLNDEQYAAATYTNDHALILAGAGSGKTRTLTYKIAYLILEKHISPNSILAVTFTNKAAQEMKHRLGEIIQEISAHQATLAIPQQSDFDDLIGMASSSSGNSMPVFTQQDYQRIGTFHGVFLRILKQDIKHLELGYTTAFTVIDANDSATIIKALLKQHRLEDRLDYKEAKAIISMRKNNWRTREEAGKYCQNQKEERALRAYQLYQKHLIDSNAVDFDDLLLLPKLLFLHAPELLQKRQQRFQYILVDEAQDTNTIQFDLMRLLTWKEGNITFIGDDYQSIYRRRGAVMDNFLNVKQRWPSIQMFKLQINYRSKAHIVQAGNELIKKNRRQYDKEIVPHRIEKDMIRVFTFQDEMDEAQQLIGLIVKLKEENNKARGDFTILYRTNAQSSPFEQMLLSEWIPYKVVGAFKFFERMEVKDIVSYLKFLVNPKDSLSLQRVINTPSRAIWKTTIDSLQDIGRNHGVSFAEVVTHIDQYHEWISPSVQAKIKQFSILMQGIQQSLAFLTVAQLIEQLVNSIGYKAYLIKEDGEEKGSERMENIGQLINIATKYEGTGEETVMQFLEEISLMTSIEESSVDEADAIRLMTVHSSKWLEFPYVFIVGLEENIFPLPKAKIDDEELEEERRGMYVAITRAKDHLFLSYAHSRQQRGQIKYNAPSRFIEEIPQELIKRYDLAQSTRKPKGPSFDEGDHVSHKLFWWGQILELRGDVAIVRFNNPKFGVRKLECRFLHEE
jgi:DNA helicase-2/ATP-dependent DNA helicase PcrA